MFSQVKNGEWLQSIAVGRRQYLGPLLLSMAWVVRSLKERCPFSMSEFLPFERCWMLVWVFMMGHGWLFAQLILCLICTLRAFCWICISIFFIYSLGRFKQEQQCHWAALDASDTYIKSMVAGVQNWQGFPFLKWGAMFLLWTKCWWTHFSPRFLPQDAMKHVDVQCWDHITVLSTTAHVPYCVCRCSEQCPCLPANGHPRPISRCLAEDSACPFG